MSADTPSPTPAADHLLHVGRIESEGYVWFDFTCEHSRDDQRWWYRNEDGSLFDETGADGCWLYSWWTEVGKELLDDIPGPVTFPIPVEPADNWDYWNGGTLRRATGGSQVDLPDTPPAAAHILSCSPDCFAVDGVATHVNGCTAGVTPPAAEPASYYEQPDSFEMDDPASLIVVPMVQVCSRCDGERTEAMSEAVACRHCNGSGIEPAGPATEAQT